MCDFIRAVSRPYAPPMTKTILLCSCIFWLSQTLISFVSPRVFPRTSQNTTKLSEYFSNCEITSRVSCFRIVSVSHDLWGLRRIISSSFWSLFSYSAIGFSKWCQESATVRRMSFFIKRDYWNPSKKPDSITRSLKSFLAQVSHLLGSACNSQPNSPRDALYIKSAVLARL